MSDEKKDEDKKKEVKTNKAVAVVTEEPYPDKVGGSIGASYDRSCAYYSHRM